jgi:hypothetical protein
MTLVDLLYLSLPGLLIATKLGIMAFAIAYIARHAFRSQPVAMAVRRQTLSGRRRRRSGVA